MEYMRFSKIMLFVTLALALFVWSPVYGTDSEQPRKIQGAFELWWGGKDAVGSILIFLKGEFILDESQKEITISFGPGKTLQDSLGRAMKIGRVNAQLRIRKDKKWEIVESDMTPPLYGDDTPRLVPRLVLQIANAFYPALTAETVVEMKQFDLDTLTEIPSATVKTKTTRGRRHNEGDKEMFVSRKSTAKDEQEYSAWRFKKSSIVTLSASVSTTAVRPIDSRPEVRARGIRKVEEWFTSWSKDEKPKEKDATTFIKDWTGSMKKETCDIMVCIIQLQEPEEKH